MSHKLQKAPQSRPGYAPAPPTSPGPRTPRSQQLPPSSRPHYAPRPRQESQESYGYSNESRGSSVVHGVASGQVGAGYGPYSGTYGQQQQVRSPTASSSNHRAERQPRTSSKRFSEGTETIDSHSHSQHQARYNLSPHQTAMQWSSKDAELDDHLHNPSTHDALVDHRSFRLWSARGWANMTALFLILGSLITFFAGYPIITQLRRTGLSTNGAWNVGGINATGQVPDLPNQASLIDADTPQSAMTRTGYDGNQYQLVFSDEFETPGRTFWPGDDPFWEAVDLHYWATGDYEWYDPDAITTAGGNLQITITQQPIHNLNFRSGMLQSWNKFCFTGGYIEVSIQLPGVSTIPGFWPGAWHGATTDGTWPFSYNTCDVGTMRNQTNLDGATPAAARTSGSRDYGGELSYQPGQRVSCALLACTCPSSAGEHPGPNVNTGRGGPEIDILEAQVSYNAARGGRYGTVSQSAQFAPYDAAYEAIQTAPQSVIHTPAATYYNDYLGGIYQQALSGVTATVPTAYNGRGGGFSSYGFEYWPDTSNGYITWQVNGAQSWTLNAAAIGPNAQTQVSQRLISEEPMSIILNLGFSAAFQTIDWQNLKFPGTMLVDYVRVYQRAGAVNVGCDPSNRPTATYINNHINAYTNPNLTTWAQAGYTFPVNRLQNGGSCP